MTKEEKRLMCSQCAEHPFVAEAARKSVPRWAFISVLSTALVISLTFSGWYTSSLRTIETKVIAEVEEHRMNIDSVMASQKFHINERIAAAHEAYNHDVERFINAVRENREAIIVIKSDIQDIKVKQAEFETKQDMVLKRIGLDRPERPEG